MSESKSLVKSGKQFTAFRIDAWMGAVRTDVVWLLLVGSGFLAFFDVYALWIWFGARATPRYPDAF
jgi:hypothetical protein